MTQTKRAGDEQAAAVNDGGAGGFLNTEPSRTGSLSPTPPGTAVPRAPAWAPMAHSPPAQGGAHAPAAPHRPQSGCPLRASTATANEHADRDVCCRGGTPGPLAGPRAPTLRWLWANSWRRGPLAAVAAAGAAAASAAAASLGRERARRFGHVPSLLVQDAPCSVGPAIPQRRSSGGPQRLSRRHWWVVWLDPPGVGVF